MSVDSNVFIGSYLRVFVPVRHHDVDLCAEHDHGGGKFCSQCGRASSERIVKRSDHADEGFWDEFEDRVITADIGEWWDPTGRRTYVMIANFYDGGTGVRIDPKHDPDAEVAIPDASRTSERFGEEFADVIEWLRARGCEAEIRYGCVHWSS